MRSLAVLGLFLVLTVDGFSAPVPLSVEAVAGLSDMGLQKVQGSPPLLDVDLMFLDGRNIKLSFFKGKVVLVNFWATWCPPCRREMPGMEKLYQSLKNNPNFVLLAVDSMEEPGKVKDFVQKSGYHFAVTLDQDGSVTNNYSVQAYPTTYVIDRQGRVIGGIVGGHDWGTQEVLKGIQRLLAAP